MHFASFDVEARSRVLCVSAGEGVPLSTQWNPQGYYYPTQIAQFSLAHYSVHVLAQDRINQDRYGSIFFLINNFELNHLLFCPNKKKFKHGNNKFIFSLMYFSTPRPELEGCKGLASLTNMSSFNAHNFLVFNNSLKCQMFSKRIDETTFVRLSNFFDSNNFSGDKIYNRRKKNRQAA